MAKSRQLQRLTTVQDEIYVSFRSPDGANLQALRGATLLAKYEPRMNASLNNCLQVWGKREDGLGRKKLWPWDCVFLDFQNKQKTEGLRVQC
jgi:hypothetical protein